MREDIRDTQLNDVQRTIARRVSFELGPPRRGWLQPSHLNLLSPTLFMMR